MKTVRHKRQVRNRGKNKAKASKPGTRGKADWRMARSVEMGPQ